MIKKLSLSHLKKGVVMSPALELVLKALANRERPRPVTDVKRLRDEVAETTGQRLKKEDLIEAMQFLERAGAGSLRISDNTAVPMRFEWSVNYIEAARAALGIQPEEMPAKPSRSIAPFTVPTHGVYRVEIHTYTLDRETHRIETVKAKDEQDALEKVLKSKQ